MARLSCPRGAGCICMHIFLLNSIANKSCNLPSEEFELTANSLRAHMKVTERSFWAHLSSSQCTHKMSALWDYCELSMSLQLSQWAHCYHCMVSHQMISWISHSKLTMWVWSFWKFFVFLSGKWQTHSSKLTESSQQSHIVIHQVSSPWVCS